MPGKDGAWLIRSVRRLGREKGGDLPALAISAHSDDYEREGILAAGFQDYS